MTDSYLLNRIGTFLRDWYLIMLLTLSDKRLTVEKITGHLAQLRHHAHAQSSHFAVSAIVEVWLEQHQLFAYVSGVNVENHEHNRLSMHAEQNAMIAAKSLFGDKITCSTAWVMGAPDTIHKGSKDPSADNFVMPCGHCRQVLLSFSSPETEIYSVTVNGRVGPMNYLTALLPLAFSEQDLKSVVPQTTEMVASSAGFFPAQKVPKVQPLKQIAFEADLSRKAITSMLKAILPSIISPDYQTSPIEACVIKITANNFVYYFQGALVQDCAFLTTDAIFSCIGQAITELGAEKCVIKEIHLHAASMEPSQLSSAELGHIKRFAELDTLILFHSKQEPSQIRDFTLGDCIEASVNKLGFGTPAEYHSTGM